MSKDECMELKNLKYQTMLLNNNKKLDVTEPNVSSIEKFLEKEQKNNNTKPWSKLGKATKLKKLYQYVDNFLIDKPDKKKYEKDLKSYLLNCLERKKLQRQKEVIYDIEKGVIKEIPILYFNKSKNRFSLKRVDKKTSTLKSLPSKKNKVKTKSKSKTKNKRKDSKLGKTQKKPKDKKVKVKRVKKENKSKE